MESVVLLLLRVAVGVEPLWNQAVLVGEGTESVGTQVNERFHVLL